jgi:hypothetical protein
MGDTRRFAKRMDLIAMAPRNDLRVLPEPGTYQAEWFSIQTPPDGPCRSDHHGEPHGHREACQPPGERVDRQPSCTTAREVTWETGTSA